MIDCESGNFRNLCFVQLFQDFFGDFIKNQEAKGRGADAKKTIKIWREVVK